MHRMENTRREFESGFIPIRKYYGGEYYGVGKQNASPSKNYHQGF